MRDEQDRANVGKVTRERTEGAAKERQRAERKAEVASILMRVQWSSSRYFFGPRK